MVLAESKGDHASRGVLLLEQYDEWQLQRRYMCIERLRSLIDNEPARLCVEVS